MIEMSEINVEVKMFDEGEEKKISVPSGYDAHDLLDKLDKDLEGHVVKVNGKIISEDTRLENDDRVETIPVVSGG